LHVDGLFTRNSAATQPKRAAVPTPSIRYAAVHDSAESALAEYLTDDVTKVRVWDGSKWGVLQKGSHKYYAKQNGMGYHDLSNSKTLKSICLLVCPSDIHTHVPLSKYKIDTGKWKEEELYIENLHLIKWLYNPRQYFTDMDFNHGPTFLKAFRAGWNEPLAQNNIFTEPLAQNNSSTVVQDPPHVDGFFGLTKKSAAATPKPAATTKPAATPKPEAVPKKSLFSRLTGRKKSTEPVPSVHAVAKSTINEEKESSHEKVMPAPNPYRTSLVEERNKAGSLHGCLWGILTTQGHHQYMRIKHIGSWAGAPPVGKLCPFDTSYAVKFIKARNGELEIDVEGWAEHTIQPSENLRYMVSPLEYLDLHNSSQQPPVHKEGDPVFLSNQNLFTYDIKQAMLSNGNGKFAILSKSTKNYFVFMDKYAKHTHIDGYSQGTLVDLSSLSTVGEVHICNNDTTIPFKFCNYGPDYRGTGQWEGTKLTGKLPETWVCRALTEPEKSQLTYILDPNDFFKKKWSIAPNIITTLVTNKPLAQNHISFAHCPNPYSIKQTHINPYIV